MRTFGRLASLILVSFTIAACSTSKVSDRNRYEGAAIAPPDRIVVYDIAATATDIPDFSEAARTGAFVEGQQSAEDIATGRKLGAEIAIHLVDELREMGMTAVRYSPATAAVPGDLIITGYFQSVEKGSTAKRVMLGFGSGASDLKTRIEGYLMTDQGPRLLGSGSTDTGSGKAPGMVLPIAVVAATANPIGLVVGGGMQAYDAVTGKNKLDAAAKETAELVGEELKKSFQQQGWL